jgi:hypothetical protein
MTLNFRGKQFLANLHSCVRISNERVPRELFLVAPLGRIVWLRLIESLNLLIRATLGGGLILARVVRVDYELAGNSKTIIKN